MHQRHSTQHHKPSGAYQVTLFQISYLYSGTI